MNAICERPPALASQTGTGVCNRPSVTALPAAIADLRALAGIFAYPEARARAEALGGVEALFGDDKVLFDCALRAVGDTSDMLVSKSDWARAVAILEAAQDFMPSRAEWAVAAVDQLCRERAGVFLSGTCRWAAARIDKGDSLSQVGRALRKAFEAAGVNLAK